MEVGKVFVNVFVSKTHLLFKKKKEFTYSLFNMVKDKSIILPIPVHQEKIIFE